MTSDFELAYFDFEIAFQNILESAGLFDTWSEDSVEPEYDSRKAGVNWKGIDQKFDLDHEQILRGIDQFNKAQEEVENILMDVFDGTPPDVFNDSLGEGRDEVEQLVSEMIERILKGL